MLVPLVLFLVLLVSLDGRFMMCQNAPPVYDEMIIVQFYELISISLIAISVNGKNAFGCNQKCQLGGLLALLCPVVIPAAVCS